MRNPRFTFTLNEQDAEIIQIISKKKKISISSLIKKIMEDWLEEYEDYLLAKRAEEIEEKWIKSGKKSIPHDELWKELNT